MNTTKKEEVFTIVDNFTNALDPSENLTDTLLLLFCSFVSGSEISAIEQKERDRISFHVRKLFSLVSNIQQINMN